MRFRTRISSTVLFCLGVTALPAVASVSIVDADKRCREAAGPPDAGTPVSREALDAYLGALSDARAACEEAIKLDPPAPDALFQVGVIRQRTGKHGEAVDLFDRAAQSGVAAAHTKLGDYYNFGIGRIEEDLDRAIAEYRKAAEQGDAAGMTTLAIMYRLGRGVEQDNAKALDLLRAASDQGYHFAQVRLAEVMLDPEGIPAEEAEALGLPAPDQATRLLGRAAIQGNLSAAVDLAALYANDENGVAPSPNLHALWTRRAAKAGMPSAIRTLGVMYEQGHGVDYDPAKAAAFYVEALETGKVDIEGLRDVKGLPRQRWDRTTAIEFQKILIDRGLYRGALDGIVGFGTKAGARKLAGD